MVALLLSGGSQDLPNSTWILDLPSKIFRMILVPIQWVSLDVATAGIFVPPPLVCLYMSQILESSHSTEMELILFVGISIASSWVLLTNLLEHKCGS